VRQKFLPLRKPLVLRRSWRMRDCSFFHVYMCELKEKDQVT
jgi:hypothetical protein